MTNKCSDFILWSKVIDIMVNKRHLTKEGIEEIISIRASINKGLSEKLAAAFPNVKAIVRPELPITTTILDPQ